ncbi:S1 RNA-binding domain-containing protein [Actinoplanes sp. NPDC049118]|uniref:S1 RNA-binding domain-containing protein n=1 Tax=Actinoplanes sp. NPDC049118 TaxID=3155769 RepID=UPI0033E8D7AA
MSASEGQALIGTLMQGTVTAVFPWGIVVDLGDSRVGLIDVLYVDDDDDYQVGQQISAYLTDINEKAEYRLRPPQQVPVVDRLRAAGHDV